MQLHKTKLENFDVYFRNTKETKRIENEIFNHGEYNFVSDNKRPFIIDCGSHIGLSILYFKSIYPDAKILGFEPNPTNFLILQKNIKDNNLKNVEVINAALSDKIGKSYLSVSKNEVGKELWTWGDTMIANIWGNEKKYKKIKVKTVCLSDYIKKEVDFLKMDIEGAEQIVLQEIADKLHFIKEMVVEYHGTRRSIAVNNYSVIKEILKNNGYKLTNLDKDLGLKFPESVAELRKTSSVFSIRAIRDSNQYPKN